MRFFYILIFISLNNLLWAQTTFFSNEITGTIIDVDIKTPLEGVLVEIKMGLETYSAKTDSKGFYKIETNVRYADGPYYITLSLPQYHDLNGIIMVKEKVNRDFAIKQKTKIITTTIKDTVPTISLSGYAENNWVLLLDVSSSMNEQNKLPILKHGINDIVQYFRKEDKISILSFSTNTKEILPVVNGTEKAAIKNALDNIKIGGTSQGAAAISMAYQKVSEHYIENGNNRILIFTDGMFTSGSKEYQKIQKTITAHAQKNINCSIFLVGTPTPYVVQNLEKLAQHGNGTLAILSDEAIATQKMLEEAQKVKKAN